MYLNKYEESILNGEYGPIKAKALKALVKMGEALGADRLIEITHAHISGISYTTIGEAGLELLKELSAERVYVDASCNPAGFDLERWRLLGVPEEYYEKQIEIINSLRRMGVKITLSCTPYLIENIRPATHISWAESNAVLYANSVLGALTNREGGLSALLAALVGRTPNYGLHIDENRKPSIIVNIEPNIDPNEPSVLGSLGYSLGQIIGYGVPYIINFRRPNNLEMVKYFLAGIGASSALGLIIISQISPDERRLRRTDLRNLERMDLDKRNIKNVFETFNDVQLEDFDIVYFGCPHLSLNEVLHILEHVKNVRLPKGKRMWLTTSRKVVSEIMALGYNIDDLWSRGILLLSDMCPVVAPLRIIKVNSVITDSVKAAHYLRKLHGIKVTLMERRRILKLMNEIYSRC